MAIAWIASRAVMVEKAAPSRTVRLSRARTPPTVSADRGDGGDGRARRDEPEVDVGADVRLAPADVVQQRGQADRPRREQREQSS